MCIQYFTVNCKRLWENIQSLMYFFTTVNPFTVNYCIYSSELAREKLTNGKGDFFFWLFGGSDCKRTKEKCCTVNLTKRLVYYFCFMQNRYFKMFSLVNSKLTLFIMLLFMSGVGAFFSDWRPECCQNPDNIDWWVS